jgi:transposase
LCMAKVQQKIAGTFRSEQGARAFVAFAATYLLDASKVMACSLPLAAVFAAQPLPIAWSPG